MPIKTASRSNNTVNAYDKHPSIFVKKRVGNPHPFSVYLSFGFTFLRP